MLNGGRSGEHAGYLEVDFGGELERELPWQTGLLKGVEDLVEVDNVCSTDLCGSEILSSGTQS